MGLPGFTAETSLYQTSGRYRVAANWAGGVAVQVHLAQFMPLMPPDGFCKPGCGRCSPDPTFPTGYSKTCLSADCEDYDVPCPACQSPPTCGPCNPGPCDPTTCTRGLNTQVCTDCYRNQFTQSC